MLEVLSALSDVEVKLANMKPRVLPVRPTTTAVRWCIAAPFVMSTGGRIGGYLTSLSKGSGVALLESW